MGAWKLVKIMFNKQVGILVFISSLVKSLEFQKCKILLKQTKSSCFASFCKVKLVIVA